MKKKVLCALLATCMVASMTACGSKSSEGDTQAAADGSISLRVWAAEEDQDLTNELVEKFKEANPIGLLIFRSELSLRRMQEMISLLIRNQHRMYLPLQVTRL